MGPAADDVALDAAELDVALDPDDALDAELDVVVGRAVGVTVGATGGTTVGEGVATASPGVAGLWHVKQFAFVKPKSLWNCVTCGIPDAPVP